MGRHLKKAADEQRQDGLEHVVVYDIRQSGPRRGGDRRPMTDLHYLPAAEALRLFRARELSPVELVTAVIERAEAVEPVINAFAETFYEQALDQARAAEARYAGRGGQPRPLDGLPVAVKEEAEVAGQRNTLGSLPRGVG
jgi:Asp-tRNA(Asn)/Glu-tRNA(Gln) amidotransferase A subunit family amidase